jgi:hypothetical protein
MRTLTCHCEQIFKVDLAELVNLDSTPDVIGQIADGSFLTCVCPTCGAELHTDLKTRIDWPSKKTSILLIPEIDRLAWLSGALETDKDVQITIGYAELADRIAVLAAGLTPLAVEAIKYHLAVKARDASPDVRPVILFDKLLDSGDLEFHIHGLKQNEVALTVIPQSLYRSILDDAMTHPENEPYASLTNGAYVSVQNILLEDDANA